MKSSFFVLLKTAVTGLLFFFLFRKVDFHQFWSTLRSARFDLLVLGFLLLWIGHYLCIFRWRMLMRPLMPVLPLGNLFGIYCIGLFFNLIFPTVVGGDVVKIYYAGKPSGLFARSFAATFLDREVGMLAMVLIACLTTLIHPVTIPNIPVSIIIWGSFLAFIMANVVIFTPSLHRRFTQLLDSIRLERIARKIDTLSGAFQTIGREWSVLATSVAISLVNQMLVFTVTWVLSEGLRLNVSIVYFLVFVPIITLISMIPITLNGLGLREYAYVSLFTAIGVDREAAVALGLLGSAIIILSALPGGVVYVFFRNRSDVQEIAALETNLP